jgi:hypothetical protein
MVLDLTTAKFKSLTLPMHGFSFGQSVKLLLAFTSISELVRFHCALHTMMEGKKNGNFSSAQK